MRKSRLLAAAQMSLCILALCIVAGVLAGCQSAQQPTPAAENPAAAEATRAADEARGVAEASLGKGAEILAQGDLALNGREQLLVVNRLSPGTQASKGDTSAAPILVARAAVLENNDGKWSQILVCDDHLKNPNGYLGGSHAEHVSGWEMQYSQDAKDGLEMSFTPAENSGAAAANSGQSFEQKRATFRVRWNKNAKRYQSFDASHERYLSELPSLDIPESILK
jgi:hypothetical protein